MQSRFMAIDCGNSRLKSTLFHGDEPVETKVFSSADVEGVLTFMESGGVTDVAMVSVGHTDVRMVETFRQNVDGRFLLLTHHTPLPIGVIYDTPSTLGLDRVAAAAGARFLFPGRRCVVVDAGTALTVDLLTEEGDFAGGTISPGVTMQFKALHEGTSMLPEVTAVDYTERVEKALASGNDIHDLRWARNTRDAIAVGVMEGMADRLCCSVQPGDMMVITGGDGNLLYNLMKMRIPVAGDVDIVESRHLVAIGLKYIYDEYEKST